MSSVTYYVAQGFEITKKGKFIAGQPQPFKTEAQALRCAERLSFARAGAIAFSRTGDPDLGEFDEAVILGRFGQVPDEMPLG